MLIFIITIITIIIACMENIDVIIEEPDTAAPFNQLVETELESQLFGTELETQPNDEPDNLIIVDKMNLYENNEPIKQKYYIGSRTTTPAEIAEAFCIDTMGEKHIPFDKDKTDNLIIVDKFDLYESEEPDDPVDDLVLVDKLDLYKTDNRFTSTPTPTPTVMLDKLDEIASNLKKLENNLYVGMDKQFIKMENNINNKIDVSITEFKQEISQKLLNQTTNLENQCNQNNLIVERIHKLESNLSKIDKCHVNHYKKKLALLFLIGAGCGILFMASLEKLVFV